MQQKNEQNAYKVMIVNYLTISNGLNLAYDDHFNFLLL